MYNIHKLSKSIKKECIGFDKSFTELSPENIKTFNDTIYKAIQLIELAEIDDDFKDSFRESFMSGMFIRLRKIFPTMTGYELQRAFGWSDELYKELLRGAIK